VTGALLLLAVNRLRVNLLRSALTVLGIVIGIAAVVSLVSLGSAVQRSIDEQFAGLGAGTLTVQPGGDAVVNRVAENQGGGLSGARPGARLAAGISGGQDTSAEPLRDPELAAVAARPGARAVAPVARSRVEVTPAAGGATVSADLLATTSALAETEAFDLAAGTFLSDLTAQRRLPVAVLGAGLAEDLGLDPQEAVGTDLRVDRRTYTVVGVLEEVGGASFVSADGGLIVPLDTAAGSLLDSDPTYDQIRVLATESAEATLAADVTAALRDLRGIAEGDDEDFSIVEATAIIEVADQTSSTLTTLISVIGAISLIVGAIGIANMMLVAVRERTREIGVRRAVGATRFDITAQFLVESVVLSVLGGAIGAALGVLLATTLAGGLLGVAAVVSTPSIVLALVVSFVVGVLAGIGPAYQAASVDPTAALRYE
jgi:putative ABC transport system permease protein